MRTRYIPERRLERIEGFLNPEDRELTRLLVDTGFRLDDVMHLRVWQLTRPALTIVESKTGKTRTVPLSTSHITYWKERARCRHVLSYAFPALRRGGKAKMHRTTYWRHFANAVARAGFAECGYSPHSLRKCYAVKLFKKRGLRAVQDDLGHKYESTSMIYAFSDQLD